MAELDHLAVHAWEHWKICCLVITSLLYSQVKQSLHFSLLHISRVHKNKWLGVRACNHFETGQNFPPVLKLVTRIVHTCPPVLKIVTHTEHTCVEISHLVNVAKRTHDQCSIFNNFGGTMGFYWRYTLLLKSPVLMCSWYMDKCDKALFPII